MSDGKRPTVATVFGVLNVIFGGFGVFGVLGALALFAAGAPIMAVLQLVGTAVSVILLLSGIFLLMGKKNGYTYSNYYVMLSIAYTIGYAIYTIVTAGMAGFLVSIVTTLIGVVYPLLLLFLVVKSQPVKSFYGA